MDTYVYVYVCMQLGMEPDASCYNFVWHEDDVIDDVVVVVVICDDVKK